MGHRDKLKTGSEMDGLTRAKRFYKFKSGVRKLLKRAVNKRARRDEIEVKDTEE